MLGNRRHLVVLSVFLLLLSARALQAQVTTGKITGTIQDPSGLSVPGVTVTASNVATGTVETTVSNEVGNYQFFTLRPGTYTLEATLSGFSTFRREGLVVEADRSLAVPVSLQLGQASEVVDVKAGTVLLDVNTSALGASVDSSRIEDMPVNGRNPLALATLVPTVKGVGNFGRDIGGFSWAQAPVVIGGGNALANGSLIDGMSNDNLGNGGSVGYLSAEAMQELKVITNSMAAEYGATGGGILSAISKSGTNKSVGVGYEYFRDAALNSNDYFSKAAGAPKPASTLHQAGVTYGGPIIKSKFFFQANFEHDLSDLGAVLQVNYAPTALERAGDFSQTLGANGQPIIIYDPLTTVVGADGIARRTPFPGNKIPANRLNPIALSVLSMYPQANQPGLQYTHANNLYQTGTSSNTRNDFSIKLDYNLDSSQHLAFRYGQTSDETFGANFFGNLLTQDGRNISIPKRGTSGQYTNVLSSSMVLDAKLGYNTDGETSIPPSTFLGGYDITKLGFPASLASQFQSPPDAPSGMFPCFNVSDLVFPSPVLIGGIGVGTCNGNQVRSAASWAGGLSVTKSVSVHTLKFGWEHRRQQFTTSTVNAPTFTFTRGFTQGPNANSGSANAGFGIASFLLGDPSAGQAAYGALQTNRIKYNALYAQDDWRVTQAFTLNIGLRWDYTSPVTELNNTLSNFDPSATVPLNVPGMTLKGGLVYPGVDGREQALTSSNFDHFGPRVGFAYQAHPKVVFRGGYGVIYIPLKGVNFPASGFSATTPMVTSLDNGLTPYNTLSDPFPQGVLKPTGSSLGTLTGIGQSISGQLRDVDLGFSQQWNFTTQYSPRSNWLVEVAYIGNKGTDLLSPAPALNQLDPQYLSLGNALNQQVPNPFFGLVPPGTALSTPTTTRQQLLLAYPQFTAVSSGYGNLGSSIFHAGSFRIEKRLSGGLSFGGSYTFGKLIDAVTLSTGGRTNATPDTGVVNWFNLAAERSQSVNDISHRFVGSLLWEIPAFSGSAGIANAVLGGWQLNVINTLESGRPIALTAAGIAGRPNVVPSQDPGLDDPTLTQWFNTAAFSIPAPFTYGNASRTIPGVYSDGIINFDTSLFKTFKLGGHYSVQFRMEVFNIFNHVTFDVPGRQVGTASFGVVSAQAPNPGPRKTQLGLRFNF
jgi:hypothetical protein